jgi:formylglycine-generating enzyme required for sulfatase activity
VGGLGAFIVLIFGWVGYQAFLANTNELDGPADDGSEAVASPESRPDFEQEARFMLGRARDQAKAGRVDEAVVLLDRVTKVYGKTKAASEAREALDRPSRNLPLFLDRPTVEAESKFQERPTAPAPEVVQAQPLPSPAGPGPVAMVLPANPAEAPAPLPATNANAAAATPAAMPAAPPIVRPLPQGFRVQEVGGASDLGWPRLIVGDRDGAVMVLVPGGTFLMGDDESSPAEAPAHRVRVRTFYMDQHEVTVGQFQQFLKETGFRGNPPRSWTPGENGVPKALNAAMVLVNARDAKAYSEWAGKQLPTEAQWEMAARTEDGRRVPWGQGDVPWGNSRTPRQADTIMAFPEDCSPYGVYDLAGNALEWTKDWYDARYFRQLALGVTDDLGGPATRPRSQQLVVKGGAKNWSVSYREGIPLDRRLPYLGFRCVLAVETAVEAQGVPVAPGSPPQSIPSRSNANSVPF